MSLSHVKNAFITAAATLAVIYVLNMTPAKPLVQKALGGA
jgi:hypothetical protein